MKVIVCVLLHSQAQGIALVKSLLENSKGVLHIEDVLPLFPEFTEIDAFKDVLCT